MCYANDTARRGVIRGVNEGHGDRAAKRWRSRWVRGTQLCAAMMVALAMAACSSQPPSAVDSAGSAQLAPQAEHQPVEPAPATPSAAITLQPANGTANVSPTAPVMITVTDGTLPSVTLANQDGKLVTGQLSADKKSWAVTEPLGFGKTYTWSGNTRSTDGKTEAVSGSFTTVKPKRQVRGTINTGDDQTFGIGMPIALTFDTAITDKAAAQRALTVRTSVPTEGAWAWLDSRTVHWRPREYWQPGTTVTVTAKLYGVAYGNGSYGREDLTSQFTIGRAQVVKANTKNHRWVVLRDGAQVADFPASYGLESDPGRVTKSGTHVVMGKSQTYLMTNPRYDYENVEVQWAVRLSNNGEFSHAAPWSVKDQGKRNVSHGCANLAPANAKAYYDSAMIGDPVEIEGSSHQLDATDGDYYDWSVSWDAWLAKSAL